MKTLYHFDVQLLAVLAALIVGCEVPQPTVPDNASTTGTRKPGVLSSDVGFGSENTNYAVRQEFGQSRELAEHLDQTFEGMLSARDILTNIVTRLKGTPAVDELREWVQLALASRERSHPGSSLSSIPPLPETFVQTYRRTCGDTEPRILVVPQDNDNPGFAIIWFGGGFGLYGIVVSPSPGLRVPAHVPEELRLAPGMYCFGGTPQN